MTTEQFIPVNIFTQPASHNRSALSFCDTSTSSLKIWIYSISDDPMGDRSKSLLNALIELSELNVLPCLKFTLVQTIHHPIDQMIEYLKTLIKDESIYNSLHKEGILDLIESFRCYMAYLYSDIFYALRDEVKSTSLSVKSYFIRKKQNTFSWYACYLALEQFSLLTCHQHMLYRSALKGQWQHTHRLYWLAYQHQYENVEVYHLQDCICSQSGINSISILYKQILLLHLLNTQQVRPSETYALYQCSSEWAHLLHVTAKKEPLSRYVIDHQTDIPPISLIDHHTNIKDLGCFYINVNDLFKRVQLANAPTERDLSMKEQLYLNSSLIFHIINTLNQSSERRYKRYNFSSTIQVCFGLKSVHYRLAQAVLKYQNILKKQTRHTKDTTRPLYSTPKDVLSSTSLDFDENIYTCHILDVSVNGYRMRWQGNPPQHLHAGEFLAVQENSQSPWRCGLIRWVKQLPNKDLEFGVEVLSQNITLCHIQQYNTILEKYIYSPALLLKKDILDQPCFFLAMPIIDTLSTQKRLQLYITNQTISVYIDHKELENPSFILCNFDLLTIEDQKKFNYLISGYDKLLKSVDL